ncbi:MAG: DMT family protein [Bacteroidia bacterium]
MLKGFYTLVLLMLSNLFMNFAWYGHLQFEKWGWNKSASLPLFILISWGIALFEYVLQVPANRIGYIQNGGPFSLMELKTIQECLSLGIFLLVNILFFKEKMAWNHLLGFAFMGIGVWFIFKKF